MQDKTIMCKDCGKPFTHSIKDQEFFAKQGFTHEPVRCLPCRKAKKARENQVA